MTVEISGRGLEHRGIPFAASLFNMAHSLNG